MSAFAAMACASLRSRQRFGGESYFGRGHILEGVIFWRESYFGGRQYSGGVHDLEGANIPQVVESKS